MQIKFRLTDAEFIESRRKSNLLGFNGWRNHCIELLCLLPSGVLVWLTGLWIAQLSFVAIIFVMLIVMVQRSLTRTVVGNNYEHTVTLEGQTLYSEFSNSEFEIKLSHYDKVDENKNSFYLWRLGRCGIIPKRAIDEEQLKEFREGLAGVNLQPQSNELPVKLYSHLFSQDSDGSAEKAGTKTYKFKFVAEDIHNAGAEPLRVFDSNVDSEGAPAKKISKSSTFGLSGVLLVTLGLVIAFFWSAGPVRLNVVTILLLGMAIMLPFGILRMIGRTMQNVFKKANPVVPPDEFELRLLSNGWAMGTPQYAFRYDWRDVKSLYENSYCVGFRTVNDLIQVVPKRIFDEGGALEFMQTAIGLQSEFKKTVERESGNANKDMIVGTETGNPFQAPGG
ncbi:MAG: YcxB family protein [Mariniblastus sp.]